MKNNNSLSPSLLEPESRGGDTAGSGFDFQSNLILVKIPYWLLYQGFTAFIQESISDIEAKFFIPGQGMMIEAIEAKNRRITPGLFWQEIERFQNMDMGSPWTYRWFTLSCIELSDELKPLVNSLRRIKDAYHFYSPNSGVHENSYKDYLSQVCNIGKDEETAKFIFHKVRVSLRP